MAFLPAARLACLRRGSSSATTGAFAAPRPAHHCRLLSSNTSNSSNSSSSSSIGIYSCMMNTSSRICSSSVCCCCCCSDSRWSVLQFHSSASDGATAAAATAAAGVHTAGTGAAAVVEEPRMPASGWALLCCGASLLLAGVGCGVWLLIDKPEPLRLAWQAVQEDPRVRAALGGDVSRGLWWGGYVHEKDARIKFNLTGPEGQRGHATCDLMLRPDGEWQILLLNFVPLDEMPQGFGVCLLTKPFYAAAEEKA